jgi:hypothetical protein
MLRVTYQDHCRACHPLDYEPSLPGLAMDHPLQPGEVSAALRRVYAAEYLKQNPAVLEERLPPRPMPGPAVPPRGGEARAAIERKVAAAEKILFGAKKCGECHAYEDAEREPVAALDHFDAEHPVKITPTSVPAVWWRSAAFSHSAHRALDCRGCHERAYPDAPNPSHQSKDVLLPALKDCVQCHAPRGRSASSGSTHARGGAGFDCTECHRYHNGDAALLGLAAPLSAPETRLTIEQFLRGGAPAKPVDH